MLQSLGVVYVDATEVRTPADYANHIDEWRGPVPFVGASSSIVTTPPSAQHPSSRPPSTTTPT